MMSSSKKSSVVKTISTCSILIYYLVRFNFPGFLWPRIALKLFKKYVASYENMVRLG